MAHILSNLHNFSKICISFWPCINHPSWFPYKGTDKVFFFFLNNNKPSCSSWWHFFLKNTKTMFASEGKAEQLWSGGLHDSFLGWINVNSRLDVDSRYYITIKRAKIYLHPSTRENNSAFYRHSACLFVLVSTWAHGLTELSRQIYLYWTPHHLPVYGKRSSFIYHF